MNATLPVPYATTERDALIAALLHSVARRADRLARRRPTATESDRSVWLRAEQEYFECVERTSPHVIAR